MGFPNWKTFEKAYTVDIEPFLEVHGLNDYAPSVNKNILSPRLDMSLSYRQVSDRLFLSDKQIPKEIFTGYDCVTDNICYIPYGIEVINYSYYLNEDIFNVKYLLEILNGDTYSRLKKHSHLDFLIPMHIGMFSCFHNLIGDTFLKYDKSIKEEYFYLAYENFSGLIKQDKFIEIAKVLKKEVLLKMEKGWIEVIPFNPNIIFLKAKDGTYDFVFKNLRNDKFTSPYGDFIDHKYIPSLLNENYDFNYWLYFGFKDKAKNLKKIKPLELWEEKDSHLSEINFYSSNEFKNYPKFLQVLKSYYKKENLYTYDKKTSNKKISGFERIELKDKILNISQLITIEDFIKFFFDNYKIIRKNSKNEEIEIVKHYKIERSDELDEIFTVNDEADNTPISVTWYDAIAYCKWLNDKNDIPFRLLYAEEYKEICPKINFDDKSSLMELDFFYDNKKLPTPPPYMNDFNNVIMKFSKSLDFIEKNNLRFCTNSVLKEWSNHFEGGHARVFSARNPELEMNYSNTWINTFSPSSNNKYKYQKIGFRVCYESPKDTK